MATERNHHKKNGFTLVEALVVAAIAAALAIAGVMAYGGFVQETRQQTLQSLAEAGAAAANAYVRKTGQNLESNEVAKLHLYNPGNYVVTIRPSDSTITVTDTAHDNISASARYSQ